ncbi:uncharacterized protein C8Q71DRAFT_755284 [Rhodofomes roseus]|uniref:PIH1 N-terminal domain-containing protein n=1 Tax=Rhodofomes roseus TaxID=34475 RepID=A0ABQ8KIY9_9APHY|nr:uncharacterized protein C8Q71DRAFT_755284 [Rhodofomes roseus]KAH9837934.1 hypothetical protein C8Q71DRAFT_755284 [Rhodofomes roseus]
MSTWRPRLLSGVLTCLACIVDRTGKPSIVFDCIYHSSLKSRALKDPAFKTFLIELAFQRIEASYAVPLARQIGTPNIKAKGTLAPRTVQIPASLFPAGHPARAEAKSKKKLVEVLEAPPESAPAKPKGILKKGGGTADAPVQKDAESAVRAPPPIAKSPELSWSRNALTDGLQIILAVPELTHSHIPTATLDVEPRRLLLSIPPLYALDLDLDLSDTQIRDVPRLSSPSVDQALMLKRQRDLDVGNARAEWRVAEGRLIVHV